MASLKHGPLFEKLLSSNAKAELLFLFNENPTLTEGAEAIARRIERTPKEIDDDLQDLMDVGLLLKKKVGTTELISYNPKRAKEIRELILEKITQSLESE